MNEQGLAQAGTPRMDGTGQGRQMVEEVKAMLMQGMTPEDLIARGVPEQVIVQAITELEQEMQAQQPAMQEPTTQAGLAAQGMPQQGMM